MHEAERSLFELCRGRPLYVTSPGRDAGHASVLLAAVEGLNSQTLEKFQRLGNGSTRLAVTRHRAKAMGLINGGPPRSMSLDLNGENRLERILDMSSAVEKQFSEFLDLQEASVEEVGGLKLTRLGRLLPAIVAVPGNPTESPALRDLLESDSILSVTTAQIDVLAEDDKVEVCYVSEGPVPLEDAEDACFMLFREINGLREHVAILIGSRETWQDPVPVRVHSACLTGDLFGSLRCDCGQQLRGSLRAISASGGGVLLYMAQEGRDIGLGNKLRAYTLQQDGLDTVDADCALGFGADERHYRAAVQMLGYLQIKRIQLLTNNPEKVKAMREGGIRVVGRQPLYGTLNRHNLRYVTAKVHRAGHWLGEMLSGSIR